MNKFITVGEVQANFDEILRRVQNGETFYIEDDDGSKAMMTPPKNPNQYGVEDLVNLKPITKEQT